MPKTKAIAGANRSMPTRRSRRLRVRRLTRSALYGAGRHPGDEMVDEERVEQGDRYRAEKGARHQHAPEELVALDALLGHSHGDGLGEAVVHEDGGEEDVVPLSA